MSYELCYIDDRLVPTGAVGDGETGLIAGSVIETFLLSDGWTDPIVRKLLSHTFAKARKFTQLSISGFLNPDFFLNHVAASNYNPQSIVLDWDFGTSSADKSLEAILDETTSKIFVLTGNDLIPEVEDSLNAFRSRSDFEDRIFGVFKKTEGIHSAEKETQENLLEGVIAHLTTIEEAFEYDGIKIIFYPSYALTNFRSFWLLRSILGDDFIREYVVDDSLTINQDQIEKMFSDSDIKFYLSRTNNRLYSAAGLELQKFYDDEAIAELTPIYALSYCDLGTLETTLEKGTSKIYNTNES